MSEQTVVTLRAKPGNRYAETGECIGTHDWSIVFLPRGIKPEEVVRVRLIPIEGKTDVNGRIMYRSEWAPVRLPLACQYAIADEARQLREARSFQRQEGEALLKVKGVKAASSYNWYYFNTEGSIFGSAFPPAALTALEFLPHASGGGFSELVSWLVLPGYYQATQERHEVPDPDDDPTGISEASLMKLAEQTTRGERVLSIDILKAAQEAQAKREAEELARLQSGVSRLSSELSAAYSCCQPHPELAAVGERLLDCTTAPQPDSIDRSGLQAWITESQALLAEANGVIEPVYTELRQLQAAVEQLKRRLYAERDRCWYPQLVDLRQRLVSQWDTQVVPSNKASLRAWITGSEVLLTEAATSIDQAEKDHKVAEEKARRQTTLSGELAALSARLADPAQAVGRPANIEAARVLLQRLERELKAGKLDAVENGMASAQQAVEFACTPPTGLDALNALQERFNRTVGDAGRINNPSSRDKKLK